MKSYVLLDAGMGGLVIILGGAALIIFVVLGLIIAITSIRIIKKRIKENESVERESNEDFLNRLSQIDTVVTKTDAEDSVIEDDEEI